MLKLWLKDKNKQVFKISNWEKPAELGNMKGTFCFCAYYQTKIIEFCFSYSALQKKNKTVTHIFERTATCKSYVALWEQGD